MPAYYETFRDFDRNSDDFAAMREDFRRDDERAEALYRAAEINLGLDAEISVPFDDGFYAAAPAPPRRTCALCRDPRELPATKTPARETRIAAKAEVA